MKIDYAVLRTNIIKSAKAVSKGEIKFLVNFEQLSSLIDDINITMVNTGLISRHVKPEDIPMLSEYFKGQKLSWFNYQKEYTTLVFVQTEAIDDKCQNLLNLMNSSNKDDACRKVEALATIIANYPCYFATIVSYMSNEPKRFGKPSYEIKCRANTVTIKSDLYTYNHQDMS